MILDTISITSTTPKPFQMYLLSSTDVKKLCKEFDFYSIAFYREEKTKGLFEVRLRYPKGNLYWYEDFSKYIHTKILLDGDCGYEPEWNALLKQLKTQMRLDVATVKGELNGISPAKVVHMQTKYMLRDYQAYDLEQFIIKFNYWNRRGLILSAPRTGKTRVALAAVDILSEEGTIALVVCPKSAEMGWRAECETLVRYASTDKIAADVECIECMAHLKRCDAADTSTGVHVRIISYDLFKKLTLTQIRQLTSKCKNVMLVCDEMHRLRNFGTQQSKALFDFKDFCTKDKVKLGIIGLTATPAVKATSDVFGSLCLMNDSKIQFKPQYNSFDCFKEYFYYCEDTSFGKQAKALRREHELKYILQLCSVQTKQQELDMFANYTRKYIKVPLAMDLCRGTSTMRCTTTWNTMRTSIARTSSCSS